MSAKMDRLQTLRWASAPLQTHVTNTNDRELLIVVAVTPEPVGSRAGQLLADAQAAGHNGVAAVQAAEQQLARNIDDVLDRMAAAVEPLAEELVVLEQAKGEMASHGQKALALH